MKKIKKTQFNEEQLGVINSTLSLETLATSLLEISSNCENSLIQKRQMMFLKILRYMQFRKADFLLVGIKSNIADKLIADELKSLKLVTEEFKNVFSQDN